jgi:hypothetical protein
VTDEDEALAREPRDDLVEVGDVVEEVVVATWADPVAVTVPAQVGCDDVNVWREVLGERTKPVREIEKAVDENDRGLTRTVPLEDVVSEPGREGDSPRLQGPASIWNTWPPTVVRNSSPRASL